MPKENTPKGLCFYQQGPFVKERDYTKGQSKLTLLYKEKLNLLTGEKTVQYDKLTPKKPLG